MSRIIDEIDSMVKSAAGFNVTPKMQDDARKAFDPNYAKAYDNAMRYAGDFSARNARSRAEAEKAEVNSILRSNPRAGASAAREAANNQYRQRMAETSRITGRQGGVTPPRTGGVNVVSEIRHGDGTAPIDKVHNPQLNTFSANKATNPSLQGKSWEDYQNDWWNKRFAQKEQQRKAMMARRNGAQQSAQQPQPTPAPQPTPQPAQRPAPRPAPQQQQSATPAPKAKLPSFRNISLPGAQAIGGALRKVPNVDASNSKIPAAGTATPTPPTAAPAAKSAPAPQEPVKQPAPTAKPTVAPAAKSAPAPQESAPVQNADTATATQVGANSQQGNWGDWTNMIPQWPAFASMGNGGGFNPMGMMMFPMMMNGGMFNGMFGLGAGGARVTPSPTDIASASSV